jgi:hypothetical protein
MARMASIRSAFGNLSDRTLSPLKGIARSLGLSRSAAEDAGAPSAAADQHPDQQGGATPPAAGRQEQAASGVGAATESISEVTTQVVFLPREPRWAYVFWSINPAERERAIAAGATSLCLRLADVTGIGDGQRPHALQEIVVDQRAVEWFLPVPVADRDYRVELGFRTRSGWSSLAFSQVARMPAESPSELIADSFIPFQIDAAAPVTMAASIPAAPAGQHERLYQQAVRRQWRHGSELFMEEAERGAGADRYGLSDSGAGPWASGRSASGAGVLPRQRSFWLVADAELIVYGATDPAATLTIGGEVVPLAADGTFRIQVPFRDGEQLYPIEATAADGEQKRAITLAFSRTTPTDHTNPREAAVAEWF